MTDLKESAPFDRVVLHPLVLLSAVDHFNRIGNVSNNARVVGALLGSIKIIDGKRVLDICNSFAVPFDEDSKDGSVWYLDHDYLETMFTMYRKVNAKERVVGWYHTGPELRANDTEINEIFKKYTPNAILTVIETTTNDWSLPTRSYFCIEEVHDDGTPCKKTFSHLSSEIGAEEAEEVGVEHLLRDVSTNTQGTLSQKISNQIKGLKGFGQKLAQIHQYLEDVAAGKLPMNYNIIYGLQDIFNLLPDIAGVEFNTALQQVTNDQMLIVYLASMIKSVIALHNLIDNKLDMNDAEKEETEKEEADRKKKVEEKEKKNADALKKKESDSQEEKSGKDESSSKKLTRSSSSRLTRGKSKEDAAKGNKKNSQELYEETFDILSCRLQQQMASLVDKLSPAEKRIC